MVVPETDLFPLLLCNVGSGVSIVKVAFSLIMLRQ
jgi:pantothenate kinase